MENETISLKFALLVNLAYALHIYLAFSKDS